MENIRFHITVKGIVVFKQKVLLMKRVRPSSDGLGYWELPGGGLEYGETPVSYTHLFIACCLCNQYYYVYCRLFFSRKIFCS